MGTAGIFTIIGIALYVGKKFAGKIKDKKDNGKDLEFHDIWTEFAGDGIQSIIEIVINKIKRGIFNAKLKKYVNNQFAEIQSIDVNVCQRIVQDVKEFDTNPLPQKKIDKLKQKLKGIFDKLKKHKGVGLDAQTIVKLSNTILSELDYKEFLEKCSPDNFGKLITNQKECLVALIEEVVDTYRSEIYLSTDEKTQIVAGVVVNSLKAFGAALTDQIKQYCGTRFDQIEQLFLGFLSNATQGGEQVTLEKITLSRYTPKYILNACPECGYNGYRLYTDEKTSTTYCAACGKSYSILKYCEPELWKEIDSKVDGLLKGQNKIITDLRNAGKTQDEIKELLMNGLEEAVTKDFLDQCLNGQTKKIKVQIEGQLSIFEASIASMMAESKTEILVAIKEYSEKSKKENENLSRSIVALDETVHLLYGYSQTQFSELKGIGDDLLVYIKGLCDKEYFDAKAEGVMRELRSESSRIDFLCQTVVRLTDKLNNMEIDCATEGGVIDLCKMQKCLQGNTKAITDEIARHRAETQKQHEEEMEAIGILTETVRRTLVTKQVTNNEAGTEILPETPKSKMEDEVQPCRYCGAKEYEGGEPVNGKIEVGKETGKCICSVCGQELKLINPLGQAQQQDETVKEWQTVRTLQREGCGQYFWNNIPEDGIAICSFHQLNRVRKIGSLHANSIKVLIFSRMQYAQTFIDTLKGLRINAGLSLLEKVVFSDGKVVKLQ